MPDLTQRIQVLQCEIDKQLKPLIDNNYVYLDLPIHANIGDTLIWEGTKQFLAKLPYKCLGEGSLRSWQYPELSSEIIIIMQGGGNFGDLYPSSRQFRLDIIEHYPHNRIVLLPQSIYYQSAENERLDITRMRRHADLHLCARDQASYNILQQYFHADRIRLVPDMAFCIDHTQLQAQAKPASRPLLFVRRLDKEQVVGFDHTTLIRGGVERENINFEIHDWPTVERKSFILHNMKRINRHTRLFGQWFTIWHAEHIFRPHMVRKGVQFVSRYSRIYTTRLHVAILAILLGREVAIIDNNYGKNSNFFNTWFAEEKLPLIIATSPQPARESEKESA